LDPETLALVDERVVRKMRDALRASDEELRIRLEMLKLQRAHAPKGEQAALDVAISLADIELRLNEARRKLISARIEAVAAARIRLRELQPIMQRQRGRYRASDVCP